MELICLGTGSGTPSRTRNVSGYALRFDDGAVWIFDCGEGTQHQILRSEVKPGRIDRILISHAHGDHCFGLPGLLAAIAVHDRGERPVEIIGPAGCQQWIETTLRFSALRLPFRLSVTEMPPHAPWQDRRDGWWLAWHPLPHRVPSGAFVLTEPQPRGRFDPTKADALGVPRGPERGLLAHGETVVVNGQTITHAHVCGPPRRPRVIGLLGDTSDSRSLHPHLRDADLVLHECTFADDRAGKAKQWGHATVATCIELAQACQPRQLVLTHFSSRYDQRDAVPTVEDLRAQIAAAAPASTTVLAAADLLQVPIPAPD